MLSAWQAFTACMILIVILLAGGPMACACGKYSALVGTLTTSTYNATYYTLWYAFPVYDELWLEELVALRTELNAK